MKKKTILVVEDDLVLQKAIVKKLDLNSFHVLTATSFGRAMEVIPSGKVDAIWLDHYLLGESDGLDLVKKLKDSKYKSIPTFVISNSTADEKVREYLDLGVNKFYLKAHYSLEDIVTDIKEALK